MLERMHPSVPICLCMVYLLGLRLTVVFSKRFGYTTFREKPPLVAKIAVFAVLPCLPLFTSGVNGDHPLCAVVSKTTFRATKKTLDQEGIERFSYVAEKLLYRRP